jgi:hypothetical protein
MRKTRFAQIGVLGCLFMALLALPASAVKIGWVSFHAGAGDAPSANAMTAGFTSAPDKGYTDLLTGAGHQVTRFASHDLPTAADLATLNTFDLIIIGRSVASGHYQQAEEALFWNTTLKKPVIDMGGYGLRASRLGWYTGETIPDTGPASDATGNNAGPVRLQATNPSHPIFAGIPLDGTNTMVNPYADVVTTPFAPNAPQRGISVVTNPIAAGGQILATVNTPGDRAQGGVVIAKFSPGQMSAATPSTAFGGHRLAFLSGSRENQAFGTFTALTSEGAGILDLTPNGRTMFLNAVNFMARVPEPSSVSLLMLAMAWLGFIRKR